MRLITFDDFAETWYKAKRHGAGFLFRRISHKSSERVQKAWNSAVTKQRTAWWEIPAVQRRMNTLTTGDASKSYLKYLAEILPENSRVLSPGCGTGEKEIRLSAFENIAQVDAFDIAPKRIELAKRKAKEKNATNVNFFTADITRYEPEKETYDAVLFDSFLHHVKEVGRILDIFISALKPNGLLVLNEYVGANRFQWSEEQIAAANEALDLLPENLRRREFDGKIKRKVFRPGLLRMILSDPSEAVNSEAILPEIHKRLEIVEEKPYGGNLLQLTLKDISQNFIKETAENLTAIEKVFVREDEFLERNPSDYVFGIYRKA